jgi:hypothetical protein
MTTAEPAILIENPSTLARIDPDLLMRIDPST